MTINSNSEFQLKWKKLDREKVGKKREISKANERRKQITTMLPEKRVRIMC